MDPHLLDRPGIRERPLRIAVVTETYPPEINGVARTVGLMVDAMLERGHEVQLISRVNGPSRPCPRIGR